MVSSIPLCSVPAASDVNLHWGALVSRRHEQVITGCSYAPLAGRLQAASPSQACSIGGAVFNRPSPCSGSHKAVSQSYSFTGGSSTISNQYFSRVWRISTSASKVTGLTI